MNILLAALLLALTAGTAYAQDWQVRGICDLRRNPGPSRGAECAQLAAEVLMLLPDKAGPGNIAVIAELADNMEKSGAHWDSPCPDPKHCPDAAYTLRYTSVSKKMLNIPRDQIYTAYVCRDNFATGGDDSTCRFKLIKVVRELSNRARKEGALLALLKCAGQEGDATGFELMYAFVQLPDLLPFAGDDAKKSAKFAVNQIAEPAGAAAPAATSRPSTPGASSAALVAAPVSAPAPAAARSSAGPTPGTGSGAGSGAGPAPGSGSGSGAGSSAPTPIGQPLNAAPGEIIMQVASLPNLVQAETLADRLSAAGIESGFERAEVNGREVFRVLAKSKGNPETFKQKLAEMGYPGAIPRR